MAALMQKVCSNRVSYRIESGNGYIVQQISTKQSLFFVTQSIVIVIIETRIGSEKQLLFCHKKLYQYITLTTVLHQLILE